MVMRSSHIIYISTQVPHSEENRSRKKHGWYQTDTLSNRSGFRYPNRNRERWKLRQCCNDIWPTPKMEVHSYRVVGEVLNPALSASLSHRKRVCCPFCALLPLTLCSINWFCSGPRPGWEATCVREYVAFSLHTGRPAHGPTPSFHPPDQASPSHSSHSSTKCPETALANISI